MALTVSLNDSARVNAISLMPEMSGQPTYLRTQNRAQEMQLPCRPCMPPVMATRVPLLATHAPRAGHACAPCWPPVRPRAGHPCAPVLATRAPRAPPVRPYAATRAPPCWPPVRPCAGHLCAPCWPPVRPRAGHPCAPVLGHPCAPAPATRAPPCAATRAPRAGATRAPRWPPVRPCGHPCAHCLATRSPMLWPRVASLWCTRNTNGKETLSCGALPWVFGSGTAPLEKGRLMADYPRHCHVEHWGRASGFCQMGRLWWGYVAPGSSRRGRGSAPRRALGALCASLLWCFGRSAGSGPGLWRWVIPRVVARVIPWVVIEAKIVLGLGVFQPSYPRGS